MDRFDRGPFAVRFLNAVLAKNGVAGIDRGGNPVDIIRGAT